MKFHLWYCIWTERTVRWHIGLMSMQSERYKETKAHLCIYVNHTHLNYSWQVCIFFVWAGEKSKKLFM